MHLIDRCWKTKIDVNYGWSNFSLLSRIVTSNPMLPCNLSILIPSVFVLKQVFFFLKKCISKIVRGILVTVTLNFLLYYFL